MKKSEKRNIKRLNVHFKVYDSEDNLLGVTRDVSSDGCFLQTKKNITKDTLRIKIELPGELGMVRMECKVMRSEKKGVGMKLLLDDESVNSFSRMIENLAY